MAEEEIAKHTKKIYKTWFSSEHSIWHKISEFIIEIIIIVFAVSISIWLHNKNEHAHQQDDVKEFLQGLKADLTNDIQEMQNDKISYLAQKTIFTYLSSIRLSEMPNRDTLRKYQLWIFNTTKLNPNDGRFEGFKSSGKIGTIENKELQNDIMDLYQENIPSLLASTSGYIATKGKLFDFIIKNKKRLTDSTTNFQVLAKNEEAYNICDFLSDPAQVLERYDLCIGLMRKIIGEIDDQYKTG
jgi:hypothetical protein